MAASYDILQCQTDIWYHYIDIWEPHFDLWQCNTLHQTSDIVINCQLHTIAIPLIQTIIQTLPYILLYNSL